MLELITQNAEICRVGDIILAHNNISSASLKANQITLDGSLTEKLLEEICQVVSILEVKNSAQIQKEKNEQSKQNFPIQTCVDSQFFLKDLDEEDESEYIDYIAKHQEKYPEVMRGEVYLCDLGHTNQYEIGKIRPVIVVQSNYYNMQRASTIVIPCTTQVNSHDSSSYVFHFSEENMEHCVYPSLFKKTNKVIARNIISINNSRLKRYLGKMKPSFMKIIQTILNEALDLHQDEPLSKQDSLPPVIVKTTKEFDENYRNIIGQSGLNPQQKKLLIQLETEELKKLLAEDCDTETKIKHLLKLFGFSETKKGYQYLIDAILYACEMQTFNLNVLSEHIFENSPPECRDEVSEIQRLIVSRVKETHKVKKLSTSDFIRLMKSLVMKGGK